MQLVALWQWLALWCLVLGLSSFRQVPAFLASRLAGLKILPLLPLLLISSGCADRTPYKDWNGTVTDYRMTGFRTTFGGVRLYDPKGEVQDAFVDDVINRLEACLGTFRPPSTAEMDEGRCHTSWKDPTNIPRVLNRAWFDVAIAPDWHTSKCTGKQLFPCAIGQVGCNAKGLDPSESCPCECRGVVQKSQTVVVTPNLELLPGTLFGLVTGCTSPWFAPFSECTAPPKP